MNMGASLLQLLEYEQHQSLHQAESQSLEVRDCSIHSLLPSLFIKYSTGIQLDSN